MLWRLEEESRESARLDSLAAKDLRVGRKLKSIMYIYVVTLHALKLLIIICYTNYDELNIFYLNRTHRCEGIT